MRLPEFEQQLDLPPGSRQHQHVRHAQAVGGDIGEKDDPLAQGQLPRTGCTAVGFRLGMEFAATFLGHLGRDADGHQPTGQAVLADLYPPI